MCIKIFGDIICNTDLCIFMTENRAYYLTHLYYETNKSIYHINYCMYD
jgi:hypothetical protein